MKPKELKRIVYQNVTVPDQFKERIQKNLEFTIQETDFSEERLNQLVCWMLSDGEEE
ncbi:hypothetical protein [Paenibacillus sedimenti]|uniref:Uncharacterized protein n=1 Tax=Paenibacillus sedimenti TaxID=2770274 RepID=A0A926KXR7_9BACL|nr:hypothetical protein [Paenibacillus sedimenti]MBD0384203.1 hypothetical protein [Paenibacillus sedimenti]